MNQDALFLAHANPRHKRKAGSLPTPEARRAESLRENAALRAFQIANKWATKPATFAERAQKVRP